MNGTILNTGVEQREKRESGVLVCQLTSDHALPLCKNKAKQKKKTGNQINFKIEQVKKK